MAAEAQQAIPPKTADIIRVLKLAGSSAEKLDEFVRAREHLAEAEKLTDRQRNPREWADVQYAIANVLLAGEIDPGDAEKLLRDVIEVRTQIFGPEDRETLKARRWLAVSLHLQSRHLEAEAEFREVVNFDEKTLGPENPETLRSRNDLLMFLWEGKTADALIEGQQILKIREKVLGPEHRETLSSRGNVAKSLSDLGRLSEAIPQWRELLEVHKKVLGPDDASTLKTIGNLGYHLAQAGEYSEGESMLRRAYKGLEPTFGLTHGTTLEYRHNLVLTLAAQDKDVEAEAEAREIVKLTDKSLGAERQIWRDILGAVLDKQGKHKEAEVQIRQALRQNEKVNGADHRFTLINRALLAKNLWYQGRNAEAETLLRELIGANEKKLGAQIYLIENNVSSRVDEIDGLTPFEARTLLANTLRDQGKYAEAEAEYKEVIEAEENLLGPEHRDTLNACYNFAYQLGQQGKRDQANALAERAAKSAAKVLGVNDPYTREYAKFLEELESGHAITMPAVEFRKTFVSGNKVVEQGPR
jgi:tetratricopeptide (TPR) repeat protein